MHLRTEWLEQEWVDENLSHWFSRFTLDIHVQRARDDLKITAQLLAQNEVEAQSLKLKSFWKKKRTKTKMPRGLEHLHRMLFLKKRKRKKKKETHTDACSSGYRGNRFLILRELRGDVADGRFYFVFFQLSWTPRCAWVLHAPQQACRIKHPVNINGFFFFFLTDW